MRWRQYMIQTLKENPTSTEAVSHQLSLRAGLVSMLTAGVYSYLPLGYRVLKNIERIIREEMDAIGCHELLMPALHPIEVWKESGRDQTLKEIMFQFDNKKSHRLCLGPTHEEIITTLARQYVQSYRQLPIVLYQIQTKFRDEMRPRFGIVRGCEFIMKDAYSFDKDEAGLKLNYEKQLGAYQRIFKRCGLNPLVVAADSGAMGGSVSHEFLVPTEVGEDMVWINKDSGEFVKCEEGQAPMQGKGWEQKVAMELGHIFQLGTKYSKSMNALFLDENGKQQPMIMGCYGIGVSRLLAAIIEMHHDAKGIIWPKEVSPFEVVIVPIGQSTDESFTVAMKCYEGLKELGLSVLLDDRDESAGRKFADGELIGIPYHVIIGKRTLAEKCVEIKNRRTGESIKLPVEGMLGAIEKICRA